MPSLLVLTAIQSEPRGYLSQTNFESDLAGFQIIDTVILCLPQNMLNQHEIGKKYSNDTMYPTKNGGPLKMCLNEICPKLVYDRCDAQ